MKVIAISKSADGKVSAVIEASSEQEALLIDFFERDLTFAEMTQIGNLGKSVWAIKHEQ